MNQGRLYHAAAVLNDTVLGSNIVVVAGGERKHGPEDSLDSVELLYPNSFGWVPGTESIKINRPGYNILCTEGIFDSRPFMKNKIFL